MIVGPSSLLLSYVIKKNCHFPSFSIRCVVVFNEPLCTALRGAAFYRCMCHAHQGYSASAYLSSKILAEMPTDAVFPLIFGTT